MASSVSIRMRLRAQPVDPRIRCTRESTALSASADYRRSPFPLLENALVGQSGASLDELLRAFSEDELRDIAVDRTAETLNYSLGLSRPLGERWQVNADITFTQLAEGPGSAGVLALPDSGRGYYAYASLVELLDRAP